MTLTIRPLEERDWPAVRRIIEEVAAAGETYAMPVPASDAGARDFWLGQPGAVVVAVEDGGPIGGAESGPEGGAVLGTAKMGPNRPAQGSHVGTASFMVAGAARGRGVGRALAEHVVGWHRAEGFRGIQFNAVVASNTAAVALWKDVGFTVVGTVPGAFRRPSGDYVDLLVMYLPL